MKRTERRGLGRNVTITVVDGKWTSTDGQSGTAGDNKQAMSDAVVAVVKKQEAAKKGGLGCKLLVPLVLGLPALLAGGAWWLSNLMT